MMALDMSDVLTDAELTEPLELLVGASGVDANGRAVPVSGAWVTFWGVVTSGKGSKTERATDATRVPGQVLVTTLQALRVAGGDYDADRVRRQGRVYVVTELRENSHPGTRFYSAVCVPETLAGV